MKILVAEDDAGVLQLLQNVRIDLYGRTVLRPILFRNEQELQRGLTGRVVPSAGALNLRRI